MAVDPSEREYRKALVARVKAARKAHGWSQEFVATSLSIPLPTYKKYESRTPIPHYWIERFCILTGTDLYYLITGHQKRPHAETVEMDDSAQR
jgi:transcriptional regulator with XRE-family HTH domain